VGANGIHPELHFLIVRSHFPYRRHPIHSTSKTLSNRVFWSGCLCSAFLSLKVLVCSSIADRLVVVPCFDIEFLPSLLVRAAVLCGSSLILLRAVDGLAFLHFFSFVSCFTMHQDGWDLERRFQMVWPWGTRCYGGLGCVYSNRQSYLFLF